MNNLEHRNWKQIYGDSDGRSSGKTEEAWEQLVSSPIDRQKARRMVRTSNSDR